jgi:RNA polymerase sigma-70 factor, ECF subfamily
MGGTLLDHLCAISLLPIKETLEAPEGEAEWLAAARVGDPRALERFFHAYQAQVYTLCLRLLGCAEEAEDATQATFVQAFRALARFQGRSSVKTWLYRIAMNEALMLLRRRRHAPIMLDADFLDAEFMAADDTLPIAERIVVQMALAQLTADHRIILVLRYWEQLEYEELSAVLNISLSAVKMRLSRARDAFRARYEEAK